MYKISGAIDAFFEKTEQRFGRLPVMAAVGVIFLLMAAMVTSIRMQTVHHGNGFTRLSIAPFDFTIENNLRYRILSPLLGYLLFFRGPAFTYFMLIIQALFLGMVYFFQRRNMPPSASLAITALCAFSTLSFHQLYFPAYTDPLSFLLILLTMHYYKDKVSGTLLLILLLFNHENNFVLFPFFFLLMLDGNFSIKNMIGISARFIIAVIPYLIYRKIISMQVPIEYGVSYYFDKGNMQWTREHVLPHLVQGVFQSFRLFWIFPLLAFVIDLQKKKYFEIMLFSAIMAGVLAQFLVAYDISRLSGLAFPIIILAAVRVRSTWGDKKFLPLFLTIFILNFLVPSIYIGAMEPMPLPPFWLK